MPPRSDYINLDRILIRWDDNYDPEQAAMLSYYAKHYGGSTWDQVLIKYDRIVILGEQGSGKTWELQARAEILNGQNKQAFFVRVEQISTNGLQQALDLPDHQRFQNWLNSSDKGGYFFLDATDECRITSHHALEAALRNLSTQLGRAIERSKIILSCRVSEWQPKTDPEIIMRAFPLTRDKIREYEGKKEMPLQTLQLSALARDQVKNLADAKIPAEAAQFMEAISEQQLWPFVGRPSDALNLIGYWQRNHRIGTLSEVVEADILHKLADPNPNRRYRLLAIDRGRSGAMLLAAATQICRTFSFPLPDQNSGANEHASIFHPRVILNGWSDGEICSLFSCAVFDEAAYGKIRFHHRTIAEYLAALWLDEQIKKGCPRRTIIQLLFRESYRQTVLIPSLAPVAAWLSIKHPFIRRKVIETSPEALVHFGDPAQLHAEDKKTLLRQLAKFARVPLGLGAFAQFKRLAIPDLAPLINSLLSDTSVARDAKLSLLLIAGEGRLMDCADAALSIATDPASHSNLIQYAIHALGSIGSASHLRQLCDALLAEGQLAPGTTSEICRACYPDILNEGELKTLILQTQFPQQNHASSFAYNLGEIIEDKLLANRLELLIVMLVETMQTPPHTSGRQFGQFEDISEDYQWLFEPLARAIGRALAERQAKNVDMQVLTKAIRTLESVRAVDHYYHSSRDLTEPLQAAAPSLRRNLFWAEVASQRDSRRSDSHIHVPSHCDLWKLLPQDMEWLLDDAASKANLNDRRFAYLTVIQQWHQQGRPAPILPKLKRLSNQSAEHKKLYNEWFKNRIRRFCFMLKSHFLYRWRFPGWKTRFPRWLKQKRWQVQTLYYAFTHRKMLREGRNFVLLMNLLVMSGNDGVGETKRGKYNREALVKIVGVRTADLTRAGFKAFWKRWTPSLREHNFTRAFQATQIAMIGLAADVEDGLDWQNLSVDLVRAAALHSLYELNGMPPWLDKLTETHPETVRTVYREQLEWEFRVPSDAGHAAGLLHDLAYGDRYLQELCESDIKGFLTANDPPHFDILRFALRVLVARNAVEFLSGIAPTRAREAAANLDRKRFALWLSIWLQVDANSALDFLEADLAKNSDQADETFLMACESLYSDFSPMPQVAAPNYLALQNLPRFLSTLYRYVNPADDQFHEGVHSPDARDHAQRFRGNVLKALIEAPPETDAYAKLPIQSRRLSDGQS